ncbi:hypothetical protein F5I97DRAFT_1928494 [Phlebopus sp. FC_14]|nr:hypothetical protein F5I97DRAFT_1928494 [Phlebopus sp. FC_14]
MEREYSVLLSYLHRRANTVPPLQTLQGLIAHCLARLSPAPTPLAATVVSSPLFRPFSLAKLDALSTSFRHAVHAKLQVAKEEPSGVFFPGLTTRLNTWSTSLLKGLEGGHAITRLACCSGLLLGLEDVLPKLPAKQRDVKGLAEDELVLAFADVIDVFSSSDSWGREFRPVTEGGEDALTLPFIVSSQALLLVPPEKFVALPLPQMLSLVARIVTQTFRDGTFLSSLPSCNQPHPDYKICIKPGTPASQEINAVSSSQAMQHMGSLSKLWARTISLFVDHRPKLGLPQIGETYLSLEAMTRNVEAGWLASNMAGLQDDTIAPETRELAASIWTILKTLLFATIMIAEAGLSAIVYVPPTLAHSAPALALAVLRTFSHLAFVIEKFGGAGHGTFIDLKRAFYLALDVLAGNQVDSEQFLKGICEEIWSNMLDASHPVQRAKKAFALSVIEQLLPVVSASIIQTYVLPFCTPHLNDATYRDMFESAHSVVLAIFSSRARKAMERPDPRTATPHTQNITFTEKMVPFYTTCLIENSAEGKLNVAQLRLAFATLVKSATGHLTLAWFCIDSLLTACKTLDVDRQHRLHLALISCIPSLPLALLPRALSAVIEIIDATPEPEPRRSELVDALFHEILENVGDAEKEYAVHWWNDQRAKWSLKQVAAPGKRSGDGVAEDARRLDDSTSATVTPMSSRL